ncbi:hypothetical protein RND71_003373 [Anisodus tanguticus]|uniref:Uncharacterized protein n=1 Tax=Anisodus tanguticus TaxID=243964 RepID=A0AAE1VPX4_9SOLA|nr:hypothetical protein RND71_003373 [Anisodus tanguticus]
MAAGKTGARTRDGTDPEREVFLYGYEIALIEKQVHDAISQTGGEARVLHCTHWREEDEPRLRYRKNIAIEELWLSCFAYYTVLPEGGMLQERR